jgi:tetratricopeptide (TPR) repeat protein
METPIFVPKLPSKIDKATKLLRTVSQFFLLIPLMLLPLFFVPTASGLLLFPKVYLVLFGCLGALLFASLVTLRNGSVTVRLTPVLGAWWILVVAAMLSALLSPHFGNALFGDALEVHTVGFLALLGLVISLLPIVGNSKKFVTYLYGSFVVSAVLLAFLFLVRVITGAETLPLPLLQAVTDNYLGSFNDLGIFLGVMVMAILVTLAQLDLPKRGLILAGVTLAFSLTVLMSVNFFFVWLLIAGFSLMVLMYVLTKDRFGVAAGLQHHHALPMGAVSLVGIVFVVSATFLIGGNALGTALSGVTGVSYIEVRPSLSATIDILRPVYADQALTGIGPNRFADAWNLYKDTSINDTVFWNTSFSAGGGYIPTWFVTTGVLGVLAWLLFLGAFLYTGVRTLMASQSQDSFWFFIGTVSFVAGFFVWVLTFIYVPGPTILILGAIFSGTLVVAHQKLSQGQGKTYNLLSTSRTGFILIAGVMVSVITVLIVSYGATKQVTAAYIFSTAEKNIDPTNPQAIEIVSQRIARAYDLHQSDSYARTLATYQFAYLNNLLGLTEPTTAQQQQFQNTISAALNASTLAISLKATDARNWQMLADIYAGLSVLNIEGAKERAFESYKEAEALDPKNPLYVLQKAAIEARGGNSAEARRLAMLALQLKPNFTDALYLLSQLDIAAGDIPTAITMTESIISLEASNPGRYYQLGVLYGAVKNIDAAIAAFTTAVTLNPSYANARYFLAQQYILKGDTEKAIAELEIVRDLSPDNATVSDLIEKIKSGEINATSLTEPQTITETSSVTTENDVTTTNTVPDSDLLSPVNIGAAPNTEAAQAPATETPQP